MLRRWSVRKKLLLCTFVLAVVVTALSIGGFSGVYSYRGAVRGISSRATELPLTTQLSREVRNLQLPVNLMTGDHHMLPCCEDYGTPIFDSQILRQQFGDGLKSYRETLKCYRKQLTQNRLKEQTTSHISDNREEWDTVADIDNTLYRIDQLDKDENWIFPETFDAEQMRNELDTLQTHSNRLPGFLQQRLLSFADKVRIEYRTWIVLTWLMTVFAAVVLVTMVYFVYAWVLSPLRILVQGSRHIANGHFGHRVQLDTQDELAELAQALNDMTQRFQDIHGELDEKVKQRTKEIVRSEQLASVGFLAAGVAHEINNPLTSIALCSESLEDRLHDIIQLDDMRPDAEHDSEIAQLRNYLRMIQDEAFRCKEITEGLLDFSRLGEVSRQRTDLAELTRGVVDMLGHIGKYKEKQIQYSCSQPLVISINPQEIKQVLLNLLANALDSIDPGGRVQVDLLQNVAYGEIRVRDNGCGMTPEVIEHLFEPFFTRRREGRGTGLGLSISYRIMSDHGGRLVAHSAGPGQGSEFLLLFPMNPTNEEQNHFYEATAA